MDGAIDPADALANEAEELINRWWAAWLRVLDNACCRQRPEPVPRPAARA
jgi:hypothetical protein